MYPLKRILVGLDLTEMDDKLIAYTSMLVKTLKIEVVYFLHIARSFDLPEDVRTKYPDLLAPIDEGLENDIRKKLAKSFKNTTGAEVRIEVKEGNAADKILRWSEIKEIDLIVMGRKIELRGKGVLPGKLAKIAHCSIFYVPENAPEKISTILAPIDFSRTSTLAFEETLKIKELTNARIILQNCFNVPTGYHTSGKSFEEFAEIMKGHANEDITKFLKRVKCDASDLEIVLTLDNEHDPAECAYKLATEKSADLIVIGSKGRSGIANILLGSVADKMTRYNSNIPLLIVKDNKENLGFFEALMRI